MGKKREHQLKMNKRRIKSQGIIETGEEGTLFSFTANITLKVPCVCVCVCFIESDENRNVSNQNPLPL